MQTTKQTTHHKAFERQTALFRALGILMLLVQTILPGAAAQAAPGPVPVTTVSAQAPAITPATEEEPPGAGLASDDQLFADVEIAPSPATTETIETADPVPVLLKLETDSYLLAPGDTAQLTVHAWRATDASVAGVPLILALPRQLQSLPGAATQWELPELGEQELFTRTVEIQLHPTFTQTTAVIDVVLWSGRWHAPDLSATPRLTATAALTATHTNTATLHFAENEATVRLGLLATVAAAANSVHAAGMATAILETQGLVLQGS